MDEEAMARAILAAGLIGVFIATAWTFAAEVGGCQAEGGSASAMAAAALVTLAGGTLAQSVAAASMASTGNYLPNALVVSPSRWATLGGLTDGEGRPVFPQASPMSNIGTLSGVTAWNGNPLGLQLVVSNQVGTQVVGAASGGGYTAKTASEYYWLVNTRGIEVYENSKGFLRDDNVSQLGVNIAVRGYFAATVVDVNMIRILGPDATFS
jgi:hypothetical protein